MITDLASTISAIMTLLVWSLVFSETWLYRLAEHIILGMVIGNVIVLGVYELRDTAITPLPGHIIFIVPMILGAMLLLKYFKSYAWMTRYPAAIITGLGVGLAIGRVVKTDLIDQIRGTFLNLSNPSNIIMVIALLTTVWYFMMYRSEKGSVAGGISQGLSRAGRYFIMGAMGYSFGTALFDQGLRVVAQISWLLFDWIGIPR